MGQTDNQILVAAEAIPIPPETLLKNARDLIQAKRFTDAKNILEVVLDKHLGAPEFPEATILIKEVDEELAWIKATDIEGVESYISSHPRGKYITKAKTNLKSLKSLKEKDDYENALAANNSQTWKTFLSAYPNHPQKNKIKKKIIQLEVDEIMESSETGSLPSFDQTGYGYSSTSVVKISNDTGCELTVRYSGSDIKSIEIPAGETRSISLSSGFYRIAASACGANYAGTEDLGGNYTCSYYIVRSRY